MRNEFYKIVIDYQSKEYVYFKSYLLLLTF